MSANCSNENIINVCMQFSSELMKTVEVKRGIRQRCVLSLLLFNLNSEKIFVKVVENNADEIRVNGVPLNNLNYADDTVLLVEIMQDLQNMLNNIITLVKNTV
ncbi:hypothetical protein M0802_001803 [Mischocyttarus mexicanus]|nr:hypothetical protein M0802_001803 [Mischocyttarus mexicanus]